MSESNTNSTNWYSEIEDNKAINKYVYKQKNGIGKGTTEKERDWQGATEKSNKNNKQSLPVNIINKHTIKFSNPKISSTPMKRLSSVPGLVQELIWFTIQVKAREYSALDIACRFSRAYYAERERHFKIKHQHDMRQGSPQSIWELCQ